MHEIRDRRDKHWFWIDDAVIDQHAAAIGPMALALYVVLVRHADKAGKLYPSMRRLEHILGTSRPTIRKHLQILVTSGLITHTQRTSDDGRDTSSLYTILSPPHTDGEMPDDGADEGRGKEFSTSGKDLSPRGKDLSGEGQNSYPSLKNSYPLEGIGFKEWDLKEGNSPLTPINGGQNALEAEERGTIADVLGEHPVCSGDESSTCTPAPRANSRAAGTSPRQVAAQQAAAEQQTVSAQTTACPHCDTYGFVRLQRPDGGYTNLRCTHDREDIEAYVARNGIPWPGAPPPDPPPTHGPAP